MSHDNNQMFCISAVSMLNYELKNIGYYGTTFEVLHRFTRFAYLFNAAIFILVKENNCIHASPVSTDLFIGDVTLALQRIALIQNYVDFYHDSTHEMPLTFLVF